jgi:hypothetical protein
MQYAVKARGSEWLVTRAQIKENNNENDKTAHMEEQRNEIDDATNQVASDAVIEGRGFESTTFAVGANVEVASRTWVGVNKPGGMGRVVKINDDGTYNVKYTVLGGLEKKIHWHWVRAVAVVEEKRKRPVRNPPHSPTSAHSPLSSPTSLPNWENFSSSEDESASESSSSPSYKRARNRTPPRSNPRRGASSASARTAANARVPFLHSTPTAPAPAPALAKDEPAAKEIRIHGNEGEVLKIDKILGQAVLSLAKWAKRCEGMNTQHVTKGR